MLTMEEAKLMAAFKQKDALCLALFAERLRHLEQRTLLVRKFVHFVVVECDQMKETLANAWLRALTAECDPDRLITLILFAGDVVFYCKLRSPYFAATDVDNDFDENTGTGFIFHFKRVMPHAFRLLATPYAALPKFQSRIKHIFGYWTFQKIFSHNFTRRLRCCLNDGLLDDALTERDFAEAHVENVTADVGVPTTCARVRVYERKTNTKSKEAGSASHSESVEQAAAQGGTEVEPAGYQGADSPSNISDVIILSENLSE